MKNNNLKSCSICKQFHVIAGLLAIIILTCILLLQKENKDEQLKIHFINVGYGDSILVQPPNANAILIDAGDKEHSKNLLEYLENKKVGQIQEAIITHPHKNHFEGFFDIIKNIPINHVSINADMRAEEGYSELLKLFAEKNIPVNIINAPKTFNNFSKNLTIKILHPEKINGSVNDNALVCYLNYKNTPILLTSDIGLQPQKQILNHYPKIKDSLYVQIPHHGRSINPEFLNTFNNAIFIASTGENPWGLPKKNEIKKIGGQVLRTDQGGTIILISDGNSFTMTRERP